MLELKVRKERVGPIRGRHPWVFSGALQNIPEGFESGEAVRLVDHNNNFLAQGYFNSYSQIAVRIWGWNEEEAIGEEFFESRVERAYDLRREYVASKDTNAYRLINSENDLLPGLIVDKFNEYLVVQMHTKGIEAWKGPIIAALVKIVKPKGIYERSDVRTRGMEGEEGKVGLLYGEVPDRVEIKENGLRFKVDIISGQKTGFFLDQRDKRAALIKYVKDKNVLNCFSYTGGFSLYALQGGAKKVVSVDSSEAAIAIAIENTKLNGLDKRSECEVVDVKEYLSRDVVKDFQVIILDPPAFVKDRRKVKEGLQGYRKINEQALRMMPPGGILVTASCSAHVSLTDFRYMLSEAAGRAGRTVQILETFTHGIDHPELVAFTEGEYLKCLFARVL
jgi:23S rRNA (cytosine1962-C5)-methyltransferase